MENLKVLGIVVLVIIGLAIVAPIIDMIYSFAISVLWYGYVISMIIIAIVFALAFIVHIIRPDKTDKNIRKDVADLNEKKIEADNKIARELAVIDAKMVSAQAVADLIVSD